MNKREQIAREILESMPKDLVEFHVAHLLDNHSLEDLELMRGFYDLIHNQEKHPEKWKKVCDILGL